MYQVAVIGELDSHHVTIEIVVSHAIALQRHADGLRPVDVQRHDVGQRYGETGRWAADELAHDGHVGHGLRIQHQGTLELTARREHGPDDDQQEARRHDSSTEPQSVLI